MIKRIITSLIGLVVFFAVVLSGILPFNIAVCILIAVMLWEYQRSIKSNAVLSAVSYVSAAALAVCNLINADLYMCILAVVILYLIITVFFHGKKRFENIFANAFGTIFITLFMCALIKIRKEYDIFGVILIFVCAWTTDTGAYFFGRFFGNHKLAPHISPKKTIEGSVGGILVCAVCCALYLFIMQVFFKNNLDAMGYIPIIIIGVVTSVVSQIGDLIASAIKRDCDVKDFGNILPGHGGVLDRFDSVLFVTPFIYFLLKLFIK